MPDYIQDPNNSKKQIPGPKTDQHFDRVTSLEAFTITKQPHYVHVNSAVSLGLGFFFGNSASFSTKADAEIAAGAGGTTLSGSQHYESFDVLAAGQYHLNPIAVSGSAADVAKVKFIYKGGLDGLGRP